MSNKELLIYDAVLSIVERGNDINRILVADIAKEAGIGKGTVYEYFSSKEEIIAKALVYSISQDLQEIIKRMEKEERVRDKFDVLFSTAANKQGLCMKIMQSVKLSCTSTELERRIKTEFLQRSLMKVFIEELVKPLIDTAWEEKIIPPPRDMDYALYAGASVLRNMLFLSADMTCAQDGSGEKLLRYAYQMFIKVLN